MEREGNVITFSWTVYEGEFRSVSDLAEGEVEVTKERDSWPLETPGLFRVFAQIDPSSEDAMVEFMRRWGPLTADGEEDTRELWQREISLMRYCIQLYDSLTDKNLNTSQLERFLREADHFYRLSWEWLDSEEIFEPGHDTEISPPDKARILVAQIVNNRLCDQYLLAGVLPTLCVERHEPMRFILRPISLIGALWLQMAISVSGDKVWRPCAVCGIPFEISLQGFRKNRIYCSGACRQKAWRQRNPEKVNRKKKGSE